MYTVPKPYPKEFRDDVVRVARNRAPGQHLKQMAADFWISESCLANWLKQADVDDGQRPGTSAAEGSELREARKRIVTRSVTVQGWARGATRWTMVARDALRSGSSRGA